jgi:hypothetical protein
MHPTRRTYAPPRTNSQPLLRRGFQLGTSFLTSINMPPSDRPAAFPRACALAQLLDWMRDLTSESRRTRRIAVTLRVHRELLCVDYLRRRIGMPEKVDRDFLEYLFAGIDGAVGTIGRFDPIDLSGRQLCANGRASVAKFDRQGVATENDGYAMPGVAVPRGSLAGRKAQPSNQRRSVVIQDFLEHGVDPFRGPAPEEAPKRKSVLRALQRAVIFRAASYISSRDPAFL